MGSFLGPGRDRWVVATKYTWPCATATNAAGNSRKGLRQSVEASLRRLRTDYLDLLWVHAWDHHPGRGGHARARRPGRRGQGPRPA